ncbi:DMT family transporter [Actinocrinis puniceicyclus]|uniref:DMT family transporter n=1 Tax=Actinocrinis puniceicyclus TaxID=977794 RepID=A0A8J8BCV3_9ACTN|nr:DMT family transporter [Actinocrinis puniceicyclus]MBS2964583.1 DMT family transporter [Actinocrinis puniceicyclus]
MAKDALRAPRRATVTATAGLLGVTLVWGVSFVMTKDALGDMPVADLMFERFALATAVLLALRPRALRGLGGAGWRHGVLIGLILAFSCLTQTYGLRTTPASVSAFITGLFVVFTPVLGALVLRTRIAVTAWAGAGLATAGLGLLTLETSGGSLIGTGELLTLACAAGWAAHITAVGAWADRHDPYALAVVQLAATAAVCLIVAVPGAVGRGAIVLPFRGADWVTLGYTALLCTAAAFFMQTYAQRRISATRTAVVMTMEPVFGALAARVSGEHLPLRGYFGAALVLAAMYLVELRRAPGGSRHPAAPRAVSAIVPRESVFFHSPPVDAGSATVGPVGLRAVATTHGTDALDGSTTELGTALGPVRPLRVP